MSRTVASSVPVAPGRLPLVGHLPVIARRPVEFLTGLGEVARGLVRVDMGPFPLYVLTGHEAAQEVLTTRADSFRQGRMVRRMRPLAGAGLGLSEGAEHRRQRRMMQPAFHRAAVAEYVGTMYRNARALGDSWHDGQTVVLEEALYTLMLAIITETMFSPAAAPLLLDEVQRSLPIFFTGLSVQAMLPESLASLPLTRGFAAAMGRLRRAIDTSVDTHDETSGAQRLVTVLRAARDPATGDGMSEREIRDQVVGVLVGGTDTTATTLGWAFHEIAAHPEVERRLHAEIDAVVGEREVRADDLPRLRYTGQVVDEVARLHALLVTTRTAAEDVDVAGHRLPAGAEVALSPYIIHRDPRFFPDPAVFDPDRWDPQRTTPVPHQAYLPFGVGRRKCIGDSFAWTEMVVVLATLCRRWHLTPAAGYDPGEAVASMPRARHLAMTLRTREQFSSL